jgi:YbbR domain-containing protein
MNEFLKDMVFYKVVCLFGAIYLFYRVGSFLVQVIKSLARYSRTHAKT